MMRIKLRDRIELLVLTALVRMGRKHWLAQVLTRQIEELKDDGRVISNSPKGASSPLSEATEHVRVSLLEPDEMLAKEAYLWVSFVSRRMHGVLTCLDRAIAVYLFLARRGVPSKVVIGPVNILSVGPKMLPRLPVSASRRLAAHAWLVVAGKSYGGVKSQCEFSPQA